MKIDPTRPKGLLFQAILSGELDYVRHHLNSKNINAKSSYTIRQMPSGVQLTQRATPLEYTLHLMYADSVEARRMQSKWVDIVGLLIAQGASVSNKAVRHALNLLIDQRCSENTALETLKILDSKVNWKKSPFSWGKTSCLDIVLEYLPGAVSSLHGGKSYLIQKGMSEPDVHLPHLLLWPAHHSPHSSWQRWFAWHPVKIQGHTVFLKTVERSENTGFSQTGSTYSYRKAFSTSGLPQLELPPAERPKAHVRQHLTPFGR